MHTILEKRFVAFLDVLGFSDRLATIPVEQLHAEYASLIDEAQTKVFDSKDSTGNPNNNFSWARFVFDSLIVVSNPVDGDEAPRNAFKFVSALTHLMEMSFAQGLPLRGCIGFGDVLDDPARGITISPAFVSLIRSERTFEWSGAAVLPDAAQLAALVGAGVTDDRPQSASQLLLRYPAPRKDGVPGEVLWCVNWVHFMSDADVVEGLAFLNEAKGPTTRAFVEFVRGLSYHRQELPERFRPSTHIRFSFGGGGMRMKFSDEAGNPKDPPDGTTIQIALLIPNQPEGETR